MKHEKCSIRWAGCRKRLMKSLSVVLASAMVLTTIPCWPTAQVSAGETEETEQTVQMDTLTATGTNSLTLDADAVTYDFRSTDFWTGCTTSDTDRISADGCLTLSSSVTYKDSTHGANVSTGSVISINVPAGKTTLTLGGCAYGSATAVLQAGDSTDTITTVYFNQKAADGSAITDGMAVPVTYTSATATTLKLVVTGSGYLHSLTAQTQTVQATATVTGSVGTGAAGQVLNFSTGGSVAATATIADDGTYSVDLPVGSSYTVAFVNSGVYEVTDGAAIDLSSTAAGSAVTDNISYSKWDTAKTFALTVGGTVFQVTPGSSSTGDFSVTTASGDGSVEVATAQEAIIWADLNGNGAGTLKESDITDVSSNVTTAVSNNEITVTYTDTTDKPLSYKLAVKDNSASGTPKQDGTPVSYTFSGASIFSPVSSLHAKKTPAYALKGTSVQTADKLVTFTGAATGGIYVNDATHGLAVSAGSTITVKVAGDATVDFTDCQYSSGTVTPTVTMTDASGTAGTVTPADATSITAATDGADITEFKYTGAAATLTFTFTGGTCYLHGMSVTNAAPKASYKEQTAMPKIMTYGTAGSLTVSPVGQRLVLAQTGGALKTTSGALDSSVSYYGFDATADANSLEADVVINTCASTNTAGIFFGAFNGQYLTTVGLRNNTNLRGIYSKSMADLAGAGGINAAITAGTQIHFTAQRTDAGFVVTATPKGGTTYTMTFPYTSSSYLLFKDSGTTPVSFGMVISNATATVTNMLYKDSAGSVLYDQNNCYTAAGTTPVVSAVTATAAEDRASIAVDWTSTTAADGDGRYVLQASKDNGTTWTDVADDLTDTSYTYPVSSTESGTYEFRVCGMLGANGTRNTYVNSNAVTIVAALTAPDVSISGGSDLISLNWNSVSQATYYDIYRYSYDETASNSKKIATVDASGKLTLDSADATEGSSASLASGEFTFVNAGVTAEEPYYYYIVAHSADNWSNPTDTVWAMASTGHTGAYVYEDKADGITITKKSYDTVYTDKITLEGNVDNAATVQLEVNGTVAATAQAEDGGSFAFDDVTIAAGRNDVNLLVTDASGNVTRKTYNFVYLTNYDKVVDAAFTGTDGDNNTDGIPTYKTVQAAVNSVPTTNTSRVVILVKEGEYEENLQVASPYVALIGEDSTKTHIFYNTVANVGGDMAKRCAVYVQTAATGFSAENLTFENTYSYQGTSGAGNNGNESADTLRNDASNTEYINVRILGYQDTLCANGGTQYYEKCTIEGNVDFIYGNEPRAYFNDCQLVFRYNANKNSGYVCAPKTSLSAGYGLLFANCQILSEDGCSGSKYYLARPWGADAYITWINCYMGKVLTGTSGSPYSDMSGNLASAARFYEYDSYGPGYAVNANRRQISATMAEKMQTTSYLGWDPASVFASISKDYTGSVKTSETAKYITAIYTPDTSKYKTSEGDDTALQNYGEEGYAESADTTGGGLLKETSENYYTVSTAEEFLTALTKVKASGQASVIELTADLALGSNEVSNFANYSSVITANKYQALLHPTLQQTGVSSLQLDGFNNLTIYSKNGAKLTHVSTDITNSSNLIIRNIKFDELWEWDEDTAGNYDRNDWDYMTIEKGSQDIWIDHCTFYKAYDGVVDVKTPTNASDITISWCQFLPGSENNTFFDAMMNKLAASPSSYPYYQSLLSAGMTADEIYAYAYAQKKTDLLGQSDTDTSASQIYVTLANNYYKDSMDRMPRLRYGTAHVYNCIMDAQDNLDARTQIAASAGDELAKHMVSNGASSCCGAHVLLQNCYLNGIENALNSGNGDSSHGYINATGSLYYMNGVQTTLSVTNNNTQQDGALVQDANAFTSALPYTYTLRDASSLATEVQPYTGAGVLIMTTLQWEKTSYGAANHNYDTTTATVTKAPTTTEAGELTETCSLCGATQTIAIPAIQVPTTGSLSEIGVTTIDSTTGGSTSGGSTSGALQFSFSGLSVANLDDQALTANEAYAVASGTSAAYRFVVSDISTSIAAADKSKIAGILSSGEAAIAYEDITLMKKIGTEDEQAISQISSDVTVNLTLTESQRSAASGSGVTVEVVRLHDGTAEKLACTYDQKTGVVTFDSNKFSTYAIVLSGASSETTGGSTGSTTAATTAAGGTGSTTAATTAAGGTGSTTAATTAAGGTGSTTAATTAAGSTGSTTAATVAADSTGSTTAATTAADSTGSTTAATTAADSTTEETTAVSATDNSADTGDHAATGRLLITLLCSLAAIMMLVMGAKAVTRKKEDL